MRWPPGEWVASASTCNRRGRCSNSSGCRSPHRSRSSKPARCCSSRWPRRPSRPVQCGAEARRVRDAATTSSRMRRLSWPPCSDHRSFKRDSQIRRTSHDSPTCFLEGRWPRGGGTVDGPWVPVPHGLGRRAERAREDARRHLSAGRRRWPEHRGAVRGSRVLPASADHCHSGTEQRHGRRVGSGWVLWPASSAATAAPALSARAPRDRQRRRVAGYRGALPLSGPGFHGISRAGQPERWDRLAQSIRRELARPDRDRVPGHGAGRHAAEGTQRPGPSRRAWQDQSVRATRRQLSVPVVVQRRGECLVDRYRARDV